MKTGNNRSLYHGGIKDDVEVVLYKPKSGGQVVAVHDTAYKLAALEGVSNAKIIEAIARKGTYFSKYHNQQVAPRYKKKGEVEAPAKNTLKKFE